MKILILSTAPDSYGTKRLAEEIEKRKEEFEIISPNDLFAFVSSTPAGFDRLYRRSEAGSEKILSKTFDAVIPRIAGSNFDHGAMILKHINENLKKFSTASEQGLKNCSNKLTTAQILSKNKIRTPKQALAYRPTDYGEVIDLVGGLPAVAKLQRGSQGEGVMILNDALAASTSLRSFEKIGANVVIQQFIPSGEPANDLRIVVVGSEKKEPQLFAYKRFAVDGDFRSNFSISKTGEKVTLTNEEREMAIDCARAVNCSVCGVDIVRDATDQNKPYAIEINASMGLAGIEKITGENIAGAIVDYVLENHKKPQREPSSKHMKNEPKITDNQFNNQKLETMTKSEKISKQNAEIDELFARAEKLDRKIEQNSDRLNKNLQNLEKQEFDNFNRELWNDPKNRLLHDLEEVREEYGN